MTTGALKMPVYLAAMSYEKVLTIAVSTMEETRVEGHWISIVNEPPVKSAISELYSLDETV